MKNSIQKHNEQAKVSTWFLLLILIGLIVAGFKIGKVYFDHATFKNDVEQLAETALLQENFDFPNNVSRTAGTYGITVKPKDINCSFNDRRDQIKVDFSYEKKVDLYVTRLPLHLSVHLTKEMAKAKSIITDFKDDMEAGVRGSSQRQLNAVKKSLGK